MMEVMPPAPHPHPPTGPDAEADDRVPPAGAGGTGPAYEYRVLTLPRGTSRSSARQLFTEQAEYGRWELARVVLHLGGARTVWLRRRVVRVRRTL